LAEEPAVFAIELAALSYPTSNAAHIAMIKMDRDAIEIVGPERA